MQSRTTMSSRMAVGAALLLALAACGDRSQDAAEATGDAARAAASAAAEQVEDAAAAARRTAEQAKREQDREDAREGQ